MGHSRQLTSANGYGPIGRRWGHAKAAAAIGAACVLIPAWAILPAGSDLALKLSRTFFRLILIGFGVRWRIHGIPGNPSRTLFVANHISWVDIPLLGSHLDAGFIAKDEVRRWPGIGRAAARIGTVFIDRRNRLGAHHQASAVRQQLSRRRGLILFAEGTTGDGATVLPFRSSLFAATQHEDLDVQPVSIVYRRRDGRALNAAERKQIAWLGEQSLLPHALGLAQGGQLRADIYFEPLLPSGNRKQIARQCEDIIRNRIEGREDEELPLALTPRN
jgi:1-acyl-sn-glycerol-3-phosphate acyltransferase